jgi:uncharacterized membrane protein
VPARLSTLAILAYPLVCHWAATGGHPSLALLWLGLALLLGAHRRGPLLVLGLVGLGLGALAGESLGAAVLRLPPIVIPFGLALVFAQTLKPGHTPIVVQIAEQARGPLPVRLADYGRGLTRFWTWLFLALAVESLALALFADAYWWSIFTNFINYGIVVAAFAGEYAVRCRILADVEHPGLRDYLRDLMRARVHRA